MPESGRESGEPNEALMNWLSDLRAGGHKVILWTCRVGEALESAVAQCREHGLEFDAVNDNIPEIIELYGVNLSLIHISEPTRRS